MGVSDRLKEVREALNETQRSMSERLGLGASTWQKYELNGNLPKEDVFAKIVHLGFSAHWLVTGEGEMRPGVGPQTPSRSRLDRELLARIMDALSTAYREENQRLPAAEQGRLAAQLYDDLVLVDNEEERRAVLAFLIKRHRGQMREAAASPLKSKRQD